MKCGGLFSGVVLTALCCAPALCQAIGAPTPMPKHAQQSQTQLLGAQPATRRAYQTAPYSPALRKRCATLAMDYINNVSRNSKRSSFMRALDAGRAAENARRSRNQKQKGTPDSTRRAYST